MKLWIKNARIQIKYMQDETITDALSALINLNKETLKNYLSIATIIANRMPGLSEDERSQLLIGVDNDKKRIEAFEASLQKFLP